MVVAFDHALVLGPIPGTEDACGQISRFVEARVDAILLNLGLIQRCNNCFGRASTPGIIVRLDWTTVWNSLSQGENGALRSCMLGSPEDALRHGADAVLPYLVVGTGDADFETKEIARNAQLARECERLGLPLMIETLARGKAVQNPADPQWLKLHTRIATELGADVIKTDYSGNVETCARWSEAARFRSWFSAGAGPARLLTLCGAPCKLEPQVCSSGVMFFRRRTWADSLGRHVTF